MCRTRQVLRFAWSGLLVSCACLGNAVPCTLAGEAPGPAITVAAEYPGASARIVADTVASPIEQQVNGVENMRWMRSRSASDGSYKLIIGFKPGTDLNMAQVLVQNRVALALPMLPEAVKDRGIFSKKGSAGVVAVVTLFSPDGSKDGVYLSNYATVQVHDELVRLPGIADVTMIGHRDYAMWIRVDPTRLSAHGVAASDVVAALKRQKAADRARTAKARSEFSFTLPSETSTLQAFSELIIKTDDRGVPVRLKDAARIELGEGPERGQVVRQGKPAVALVVHLGYPAPPPSFVDAVVGMLRRPDARRVRDDLERKLSELRARFPDGIACETTFDFAANLATPDRPTGPACLLADVAWPAGASPQRARQMLEQCDAMVRKIPGVQDVLTLSENPLDTFSSRGCLLVRLAHDAAKPADRERIVRAIRTSLGQVPEVVVGLRDLSRPECFPTCAYPVDLAISGPARDRVNEFARKLAERLRKTSSVTDVWASPESSAAPQIEINIDRAASLRHGVAVREVTDTIEVFFGLRVSEFMRFGKTWPVILQVGEQSSDGIDDTKRIEAMKRIEVRGSQGAMVALSQLATLQIRDEDTIWDRLDMYPMAEITANPAPGESLAAVRELCETLADEARKDLGLPADYRITWLE